MTFDERYHRNAETVEDENPPPPMTRDEAKKRIERLIEHVVETQGNLWSEDAAWYFYDALATLLPPCACGGGEPLAKGYVSQQSMQEYEEMRWTLSVYPRHSKHANIRVLVFAVPRGKPDDE